MGEHSDTGLEYQLFRRLRIKKYKANLGNLARPCLRRKLKRKERQLSGSALA